MNPSHAHCSHCGQKYEKDEWPRVCQCGSMTWRSTNPVMVAVTPAVDEHGHTVGLVAIERALEPKGWALPGGFLEFGEDWKVGVVREVREETGIELDPEDVRVEDLFSTGGANLLIFCTTGPVEVIRKARGHGWEPKATVKLDPAEVSALRILEVTQQVDMLGFVFSSHADIARRFLDNLPSSESYVELDAEGEVTGMWRN